MFFSAIFSLITSFVFLSLQDKVTENKAIMNRVGESERRLFNQSGLQFLQINTPDPMPTGRRSYVNRVKLFSTAFILHRWWFNTLEEKYPILSLNVIQ